MNRSESSSDINTQIDRVLADLQWASSGPTLWGELPPPWRALTTSSATPWSTLASPKHIPNELRAQRKAPIGRYFEQLVAFWVQQQPGVSQFHHSLKVQAKTGTLGELDILFEHKSTVYHWELAVKFYLGVGDLSQAASWHGPRARDRLDKKLEQLLERQLRLPSHPETQQFLDALDLQQPESHPLVKGYLFHPFDRWQDEIVPEGVPRDHQRGWWISLVHCHDLQALPAAGWRVLRKPDWLARWRGAWNVATSDLTKTLEQSVCEHGPTMVAAIGANGYELHRGFVVPASWAPLQ